MIEFTHRGVWYIFHPEELLRNLPDAILRKALFRGKAYKRGKIQARREAEAREQTELRRDKLLVGDHSGGVNAT